ncbi:MAG: LPS assembly lipoprotein LptE [Endomicrobium sp.]|nr:LPS assembly lipoprotein LptE [Endomicrobium sp.]
MKKITVLVSLFALLSMSLLSCVSPYDPAVQILQGHIKKIYVKPVINSTGQFGLETFTNVVMNEVLMDGHLSLVNDEAEADGVLTVAIRNYVLQPLFYDENNVPKQYKLWIISSASLIDKENDVILWIEPSLEGVRIYRDIKREESDVAMDNDTSEDDVRNIVLEKMARNIVRRAIKGFESVTSVSEKKVPAE